MESGIKFTASRSLQKLERKVIEKNRRNQMKFLYSRLYSLVPPHFISKEGNCGASDRVDRTIEYIQALKDSIEMCQKKKEKLLNNKRAYEHMTKVNTVCCKAIDVQVHEISHDMDAVLVTGLDSYSGFRDVVRVLGRYSAEVTFANYSSTGHSTFHIRQKQVNPSFHFKISGSATGYSYIVCNTCVMDIQIEADEVCKRVKNLGDGYSNDVTELYDVVPFCNELVDQNLSIWDFDFFQSSAWECELGTEQLTSVATFLERNQHF